MWKILCTTNKKKRKWKILNHNAMKMYDNSTIAQMAIVLLKQITTHTKQQQQMQTVGRLLSFFGYVWEKSYEHSSKMHLQTVLGGTIFYLLNFHTWVIKHNKNKIENKFTKTQKKANKFVCYIAVKSLSCYKSYVLCCEHFFTVFHYYSKVCQTMKQQQQ